MEGANTVINANDENGTTPINDDDNPSVTKDLNVVSESPEQSDGQVPAEQNSAISDKPVERDIIVVKESESKSINNAGSSTEGVNETKKEEATVASEEFKVNLNLDQQGDANPHFCRVNTLYQIREKSPEADKTFNYSYPDLRKTRDNSISVRHVTSALLVANRKNHRVAAVVAQPRVQFITEDHGFETPTKHHSSIMAENGDDVSVAGSTSAVVVTTAPQSMIDIEEGEDDGSSDRPPLQRRISLNPRMMTPPGLEVLKNKAVVIVRQQMDTDIMERCGAPNTYMLMDINDEQLFFAGEASSCFCRWVCGPNRQFAMELFSATDDFVFSLHRTCCRCDWCCCLDCFLCNQKLYITDCMGRTLGAVKQMFGPLGARFEILDHDNNVLFKIKGSCCVCRCTTDIYFKVMDKTGDRQIGKIQKKWGGDRLDNVNVDHEYFDVSFPPRLDCVDKALILAAAFLVNYMYFEMS